MSIPLIYRDTVVETYPVLRTGRKHISYDEYVSYSCHLAKNIWNQTLHLILEQIEITKKVPTYGFLDKKLNKKKYYEKSEYDNYHKLPAQTSQHVIRMCQEAYVDYKKGKYEHNYDPDKFTGKPRKPKFKKKDGEYILKFTNQEIKFRERDNGTVEMLFPGIRNKKEKINKIKPITIGNINDKDSYILNLLFGKFDEVRIVPDSNGYWIEVVCDREIAREEYYVKKYNLDQDIIMSIDLNVDNIVAITDNVGHKPIIVNSDIVKDENQWYNKRRAELNGVYDRQKIGCKLPKREGDIIRYIKNKYGMAIGCKYPKKYGEIIDYLTIENGPKMKTLTENRNNLVLDAIHKLSRTLVKHALRIKAKSIIFGKNLLWKQKVNIGRKNNQNFVSIPHAKLIRMTRYKASEVGIDVYDFTEEYTSKCSFPDTEDMCHHEQYMGKRVYRGLFVASQGMEINADVQGSYNILRKNIDKIIKNKTKFDNVYPKFTIDSIIEGVVAHRLVPIRLSIADLMSKSYEDLGMSHILSY
jgi:putative transposase